MSLEVEQLKCSINKSVIIYMTGCCCFVFAALASIWFGYYLIANYGKHDMPLHLTIISVGGILLLWEMFKAFRLKASLPQTFKPITENEYPALFNIIAEVTSTLNLSPIRKVYICPEATAAVFIQPQFRDLFFEPKRNLVFGLGFLTQMDDDEVRAVLYHEFGHYIQDEMKKSLSVYTIGQFSHSFVAIKKLKKRGTWETQLRFQLLLFTYFTIWVCNRINKAYSQLAKQMEYDADDVAVKYVGTSILQRTLLHAACIRYNYEVMQWGIRQLQAQHIQVDNQYLALSFVASYSRPTRRFLSNEIVKRVERLGQLGDTKSLATNIVRQSAILLSNNSKQARQSCTASQFAQWLRKGFEVYAQQRLLETSVELEIHLDKRKHRLPLFEGSYKILLDGKDIGKGNFIKGYTFKRKISPGKHTLTAYAPMGIISTPFEFEVVSNESYRIGMDYKLHARHGVYDVFADSIMSTKRSDNP